MEMIKLRDEYLNNRIVRDLFLNLMHDKQLVLAECGELIKNSGICKIEILEEGVIVSGRDRVKLFVNFDELPAGIALRLLNLGGYEVEEFNMAKNLIKENDIVFDIGANIGYFSLSMLYAKNSVTIHAFEPVKTNFINMNKNISINQYKGKLKTHNLGFYNKNTEIEFYVPNLCGAASIKNILESESVEKIKCKLMLMDEYIAQNPVESIDFIKCDVEGAEKFVFEGGSETIQKYKPIIFSEMLRKHAKKFNYHPNEIIDMMKQWGCRCFILRPNERIQEFFVMDENTVETNFFFFHEERHIKEIHNYCIK